MNKGMSERIRMQVMKRIIDRSIYCQRSAAMLAVCFVCHLHPYTVNEVECLVARLCNLTPAVST